jgi:hypothetical protein
MDGRIAIPASLGGAHPFVKATLEHAQGWGVTPDGRLQPEPEPGVVEIRVSPVQLDRALRLVQALIDAGTARGMQASKVVRAREHRPGIGIGRGGQATALRVEEIRCLVAFADLDLEQWRQESPHWAWMREDELRERGWVPRACGKLRVLLPRRYGRAPRGEAGWRFSFTDQTGRPLEVQLNDVVLALEDRSQSRHSQ